MKRSIPEIITFATLFVYFLWIFFTIDGHRLGVFDYGIYQQALFELSLFQRFNPYISLRDVLIFNDHFDPILIVVAPIARFLSWAPWTGAFIEICFISGTLFFLLGLIRSYSLTSRLFLISLLLFSRPLIEAVIFPLHPSTWALLPTTFLILGLYHQRTTTIICSAFVLCLFKEIYPFALCGLALYYGARKKNTLAICLGGISSSFLIFEFFLRHHLLGTTVNYSLQHSRPLLENPLESLTLFLSTLFSFSFFLSVFPIIALLGYLAPKLCTLERKFLYAVGFYTAPLLMIHLLAGYLHHHYALIITAPLYLSLFFLKGFAVQSSSLSSGKFILIALLMLSCSLPLVPKLYEGLQVPLLRYGTYQPQVREEWSKALIHFDQWYDRDQKVYATGSAAIKLLAPQMKIYHHANSAPQDEYELLILERDTSLFTTWPLSNEQIETIIKRCRPYASSDYSGQFFYIARGSFPQDCIYQDH